LSALSGQRVDFIVIPKIIHSAALRTPSTRSALPG
jgi:hypothetical protein